MTSAAHNQYTSMHIDLFVSYISLALYCQLELDRAMLEEVIKAVNRALKQISFTITDW
jgi:hypothetical protein